MQNDHATQLRLVFELLFCFQMFQTSIKRLSLKFVFQTIDEHIIASPHAYLGRLYNIASKWAVMAPCGRSRWRRDETELDLTGSTRSDLEQRANKDCVYFIIAFYFSFFFAAMSLAREKRALEVILMFLIRCHEP